MAAKTPDRIEISHIDGDRVIKGIFSTTNIDDTDTWDPGLNGTYEVVWKATNATDLVAATISGGVVTFASTGNDHNGECWVIGPDY